MIDQWRAHCVLLSETDSVDNVVTWDCTVTPSERTGVSDTSRSEKYVQIFVVTVCVLCPAPSSMRHDPYDVRSYIDFPPASVATMEPSYPRVAFRLCILFFASVCVAALRYAVTACLKRQTFMEYSRIWVWNEIF